MSYKKYLLIIKLIIIFQSKIFLCFQIKLALRNQVYQFPINHNLYRRLSEKIRDLSYYEYEKPSKTLALPVLDLSLGIPPQNFSLIYSTGKHATWLYRYKANDEKLNQKYFDKKISKTLLITNELYEINYFTFGTLCEKVLDYISINNSTSIMLSFMLVYYLAPNSLLTDGELGLARKYRGIYSDPYITKNVSNYSFIEGLYNDNKIENKIFAHKWTSEKEGILYIGEYPLSNKEIPYFNFYTCESHDKIGELNQYWNCFINGIKIGNKNIDYSSKKEIGIFSTGEKFIFAPDSEIEIINYIKNYSQWGKDNCILDEWTAYKELHCNYKSFKYSYFPSIYFYFSGYEVKLNPKDLFYYNDNNKYYRLLIVLTNKKDYWTFGSMITNKHNMIFNGENGTVTFFKMKTFLNFSSLTNYLLLLLLFFTLIGFYFIIKVYYFKRIYNSNNKVKNKIQEKLI